MTRSDSIFFIVLFLCFPFIIKGQVEVLKKDSIFQKEDSIKAADYSSNLKSTQIEIEYNCLAIEASRNGEGNNSFGNLIVNQDKGIEELSLQYIKEKKIIGYKIQIFSGHSRWEASKVRADFISENPDFPTPDLIYQSPNFKLRVGNYKSRFEAEKKLAQLKEHVSSAFIIKDQIDGRIKE